MSPKEEPQHAGWTEKLNDGTELLIRAISTDDVKLEHDFLQHLSPEFRRYRFLGLVQDPTPEVVRELTEVDPRDESVFIAVVRRDGEESEIGAARFRVNKDGTSCDCSVTVSDAWQKRGVGSLLMRHLIEAARARGVRNMHAVDPVGHEGSHQLATRIGFQRRQDPEDPATVIYELPLN